MNIIQLAKEFAIKAHLGQKYGKMPYEYHLQQVVNTLIHWRDLGQWEITDEMIAVAWLHDVIEDTDTTCQQVYDIFGLHVAKAVVMLSKTDNVTYEEYISGVKCVSISKLVKMSDTLCNLEASILSGEIKRINKYSKQLALLTEV